MTNKINHPRHYNQPVPKTSRPALRQLGITNYQMDNLECIEFMEDVLGPAATYWWCVGSGLKYLSRAGLKRPWWISLLERVLRRMGFKFTIPLGAKTDYEKARWCLQYAVDIDPMDVPAQVKENVKAALEKVS